MTSQFSLFFLVAILLIASVLGCGKDRGTDGELLIFAAASLEDALGEIEEMFEEGSNINLAFSYGGSQTLAQQIASGAPADVFISAGKFPVEFLMERRALKPGVTDLLVNSLVVVTRLGQDFDLASLDQLSNPRFKRIALAAPDLAPAGGYAREALQTLDLWNDLEQKIIFAPDVRATMAYVESGNADIAMVYITDANMARGLGILDIVPPESYPLVTYPVAVVDRPERDEKATNQFLSFLRTSVSKSVFDHHGFQMAEESQ